MERSTHTLAVKSQKWLVQALLSLIQQKPYEEISISELCKAAELDRRTFYRNFKDKTDVLHFYFYGLQEEYLLALKKMPERSFYSLALVYFKFWTNHLNFFKAAQSDNALTAVLLQMLNSFVPGIYAGEDGSIPKELQYNIAFVAGGFHNTLIGWITTGYNETAEELAAIISDMFKDNISYWPVI